MPVLPDKFSLKGSVPINGREIAKISYDTPLADAGKRFGAAIAGIADAAKEKKEPAQKPADATGALSEALKAIDTAHRDFAAAPDPGQAGINAADYLDQAKAKIEAGMSADDRTRLGPALQDLIEGGKARLGKQVEDRRRDGRIADVTGLFPQLAAQHAALADPTARQEIGGALFGSIDRLLAAGDIDEARAQAMRLDLQRQIVRADVLAQSPEWRIEHLQPGKDGAKSFFYDTLGKEESDFIRYEALREQRLNRRETGTQDLLDRYGSSPEGEAKAVAEIQAKYGDDPAFPPLYHGKLAQARVQQGRDQAKSASTVYGLAFAGKAHEIAPADRKRLDGQIDAVLDAAQYARSTEYKGDLLFKERYLAMSPQERAGYGFGELAKRLSAADFLEVMQEAAGEPDEGQRARMEGFVSFVRPMLRAVSLGEYATPQELERDRRLLDQIRDEVRIQTADEEKKKGRDLSMPEYETLMRRALGISMLRHERAELERRAVAWPDRMQEVQ